MSKLPK